MELKINYQYTYFIHPFVVKQKKYQKYILRLLKDKNCKLKRFEKEKDLRLYKYFTPKMRDFLFSSFSFTNAKYTKFKEMPIETQAAVLSKYPCSIFEYTIKNDIQGKAGDGKGIFFKIRKMEIICFQTGICFLCMKTNIEDNPTFSDVLNFNYKFRDIKQDNRTLNNYDKINIQTDSFASIDKLTDFIKGITGSNVEAIKLDIDTERFLTYSYVCIDQSAWNVDNPFENIENNFIKFVRFLPADNSASLREDDIVSLAKWKYTKMGITKYGVTLFSSSTDINNYTTLPNEFEQQYLYTYIFELYKKIYLKKLSLEFKHPTKIKEVRKEFIAFTKNIWIQEVTEDETGTMFDHKVKEMLGLEKLYNEVKTEYDILYKELNIEKNKNVTIAISIILIASLIFNILNFVLLSKY